MENVLNDVTVNLVTDSETSDLNSVSSCFHDLGEVFSKNKATSVPLTDHVIVPLT